MLIRKIKNYNNKTVIYRFKKLNIKFKSIIYSKIFKALNKNSNKRSKKSKNLINRFNWRKKLYLSWNKRLNNLSKIFKLKINQ